MPREAERVRGEVLTSAVNARVAVLEVGGQYYLDCVYDGDSVVDSDLLVKKLPRLRGWSVEFANIDSMGMRKGMARIYFVLKSKKKVC